MIVYKMVNCLEFSILSAMFHFIFIIIVYLVSECIMTRIHLIIQYLICLTFFTSLFIYIFTGTCLSLELVNWIV